MKQNNINELIDTMEQEAQDSDPKRKRAKELLDENQKNRDEVMALQKAGKPIPEELMRKVKAVFTEALNLDETMSMKALIRMNKRQFRKGLFTGLAIATVLALLIVSII